MMRYIQITFEGTSIIVTPEEAIEYLQNDFIDNEGFNSEVSISVVDMTEEDVENLPDFEGW